jgi:hypothetical protein
VTTRRWSRRGLLRLLAIAVPAITIPPAIRFGALDLLVGVSNLDLLRATDSTFSPYVGQQFKVDSGGVSHLELREVFTRGPSSFSVFFRGPGEPTLGQATYEFEHAELGHFPLLIVPARRSSGDQLYEAVFNHQAAA